MINLVFEAIKLVVSLVALAWAAHLVIRNAEDLIELTGISEASAGFVILALISSSPEFTVGVFSVYEGVPGVSIGDVLGSHIFNIGFIIGILAVLGGFRKCRTEAITELVDILFLASIIPVSLVLYGPASPFIGVVLIGIFVFSLYRMVKRRSPASANLSKPKKRKNKLKIISATGLGAALTITSSRFAILSASEIINATGILPIVIGAKIVAIGTSLPELTFCYAAVKARRPHLALGDAIGANLTTITLVLGFVLITSPFTVDIAHFMQILLFVLVTNLILWRYFVKGYISPVGGIILLITYIIFQATP